MGVCRGPLTPFCYVPLSPALCHKPLPRASVQTTVVFKACRREGLSQDPRFCYKPCRKKAAQACCKPDVFETLPYIYIYIYMYIHTCLLGGRLKKQWSRRTLVVGVTWPPGPCPSGEGLRSCNHCIAAIVVVDDDAWFLIPGYFLCFQPSFRSCPLGMALEFSSKRAGLN